MKHETARVVWLIFCLLLLIIAFGIAFYKQHVMAA